ncbi:MAG: hypothetical protein LBH25_10375 [Fibromonadaceae bacterium]|jgi:hypothetical protein|nr:hypothetical protein [Fibromonadaceae bacterium]
MKKALFAIFTICLLLAGLFGCVVELPEPPEQVYAWANESGVDVKMVVVKYYQDHHLDNGKFTYEKIIADGDTLHDNSYYYYTLSGYSKYPDREWYPFNDPSERSPETTKVKLVFLDELEKCLIFDGEIEDSFDIRNRFSYKKGELKEVLIEGTFYPELEFVYAITQKLRDMAEEKHCGDFL